MRVTGGALRGRRLVAPAGMDVRPTSDKVREALFSMLMSRFGELDGATVLDVFAGAGTLGIEALSRGAASAVFVEKAPAALDALGRNLSSLMLGGRTEVRRKDGASAVAELGRRGRRFDLIFMDPPYGEGLLGPCLGAVGRGGVLAGGGILVAERDKNDVLADVYADGALRLSEERAYGRTVLCFYRAGEPEGAGSEGGPEGAPSEGEAGEGG